MILYVSSVSPAADGAARYFLSACYSTTFRDIILIHIQNIYYNCNLWRLPWNRICHNIIFSMSPPGAVTSRKRPELFISQPAVSKAIQKLEQTLNTVLPSRPRGVTLTRTANCCTVMSGRPSPLWKRRAVPGAQTRLGISHLRIGASTTLCKYVLLPYLQRFIQLHPHVKITITCQSTYRTSCCRMKKSTLDW
ncbi:MAG: LysR family transcriptional regulator [Eisenbergiella sp.]